MNDFYVAPRVDFDVRSQGVTIDLQDAGVLYRDERAWRLRWYHVDWSGDASAAALQEAERLLADPAEDILLSHPEDVVRMGTDEMALMTIAVAYHESQYDQRADAAEQALTMVGLIGARVRVSDLTVVQLRDASEDVHRERRREIVRHLVNPVDSEEALLPQDVPDESTPQEVPRENDAERGKTGVAGPTERPGPSPAADSNVSMSSADRAVVETYFSERGRTATTEEWTVLDTYWSDHCRHTTFRTELTDVTIAFDPVREMWEWYRAERVRRGEDSRPVTLMDLATAMMRWRRADGTIPEVVFSAEINACTVEIEDDSVRWLILFKNETHNHPTEIEPFGGAATCLGGAIRDPLSGRAYVYQAMRVTGSADPRDDRAPLPGKLSQRNITRGAARGYSSYGNQIGIATGLVDELYHPGYRAKRLEMGAVVGAVPADQVRREVPEPGDVVVLIGGRTGRDGIGGATGSSRSHDRASIGRAGAEVQKGNPPRERALQRLFRKAQFSRLVKRSNDFGAGGVAVAVGEIADGVDINLDAVPLKYADLTAREIAVSESQERMAIVVAEADVAAAVAFAAAEDLEATAIARVTADARLVMRAHGRVVVDIERGFLDSAGARMTQPIRVSGDIDDQTTATQDPGSIDAEATVIDALAGRLADLRFASRHGISDQFDSSIGAGTLLAAGAGRLQRSPVTAMAARVPHVMERDQPSRLATIMAYGADPDALASNPFRGAYLAVVESVARVVAAGASPERIWLSLQEYFPRPGDDPSRWGLPLAALLGAMRAQRDLGITAIGGKDSMSGSFETLDVPPTLISVALGVADHEEVRPGHCTTPDRRLVLLHTPEDHNGIPDSAVFLRHCRWINRMVRDGAIDAVAPVRGAGWLGTVAQMCFGENLGFEADLSVVHAHADSHIAAGPLIAAYGSFVVEIVDESAAVEASPHRAILGETRGTGSIRWGDVSEATDELYRVWSQPLEEIFPTSAPPSPKTNRSGPTDSDGGATVACALLRSQIVPSRDRTHQHGVPRVVIPVFSGTNCEDDSARLFRAAGAIVEEVVVRSGTPEALSDSLSAFAAALESAQILMLPGGFSAGDEPGGSAKYISAVLRSDRVREALEVHFIDGDGLILGICNGFQALVRTGLVPFGRFVEREPGFPALAPNTIGRHVSRMVLTRIESGHGPWLDPSRVGEIVSLPVSHGEGRFVAPPEVVAGLVESQQIAFRYVDWQGRPREDMPWNPNGSVDAVEGLISPDGRFLGRMGHIERRRAGLDRHIPTVGSSALIEQGVAWYR